MDRISRDRLPNDDLALCHVCGITLADTRKASAKWTARHTRHRRNQRRDRPRTPHCRWSREANRLYLARYHGRSDAPRCIDRRERDAWVTAQSICDECGITAADTVGRRWARRHELLGTEACEPARRARIASRGQPQELAKQRQREQKRRRAAVARRIAGEMPDEWHGTHRGKLARCGCAACRDWRAERSREQLQRRRADAARRRAEMDGELPELDADGLDAEERELERRLAS
ncbi:MAG: hypothetical protein F4W93_13270 [Dehalococcoidia bacterium]|nr:hypothetical protein [Dehalococcoidia bacterium]